MSFWSDCLMCNGLKSQNCPACRGRGRYFQPGYRRQYQTCPECGGRGKIAAEPLVPCPACRGAGIHRQNAEYAQVRIPMDLARRIDQAAARLNLGRTAFVRMVLSERMQQDGPA